MAVALAFGQDRYVAPDPTGQAGSGAEAVSHYGGGRALAPQPPRQERPDARLYRTGATAIEPTLGLGRNGSIFYTATARRNNFLPKVLRSSDGGRSWEIVSPRLAGQNIHATTLGPYTYVDPRTGRVFTVDFVGCNLISHSDDAGRSWTTPPPAGCGYNTDHQTLFAGPPRTSKTVAVPGAMTAYATWKRVRVADNGVPQNEVIVDHEAAVAADERANIYYSWVARDRLPYLSISLSISRDGGDTWSEPVMTGPPGLTEASLPALAIGEGDNLVFGYLGSTNSPGPPFPDGVAEGFPSGNPVKRYEDVTWNGYLTVTTNVLSGQPVFHTASANDPREPLIRGECGPLRCQAEFDFIDVQVGPDGRPYSMFVDACREDQCYQIGEGVLGTLVSGPNLEAGTDAPSA